MGETIKITLPGNTGFILEFPSKFEYIRLILTLLWKDETIPILRHAQELVNKYSNRSKYTRLKSELEVTLFKPHFKKELIALVQAVWLAGSLQRSASSEPRQL